MKKCIWCSKTDEVISFNNKAHTFPQSLGGVNICENVCDVCNSFFGSKTPNSPSIEIALKEILNMSKYLVLNQTGKIPKNKRFKSEYFNINWEKGKINTKPKYNLNYNFQAKIGRLFKRGIYKIFLEERERQIGDAHHSRYDFIRQFSRYDLNDLPIFVLKPKFKIIISSEPDLINPVIRFTNYSNDLDKNFRIYEYQIMSHYFCIPTSSLFSDLCFDNYRNHLLKDDGPFGKIPIEINFGNNVDFMFNHMRE